MTLDLDAIRARADVATPGPWTTDDDGRYGRRVVVDGLPLANYREIAECSGYVQSAADTRVNSEFIAAARSDVPALLAEVERLRAWQQTAREYLMTTDRVLCRCVGSSECDLHSLLAQEGNAP